MQNLGLTHGESNSGVPYCCTSCISGELTEDLHVQCDKGILMKPNEYCDSFCLDKTRTPEEVTDIVKDYIQKNS